MKKKIFERRSGFSALKEQRNKLRRTGDNNEDSLLYLQKPGAADQ